MDVWRTVTVRIQMQRGEIRLSQNETISHVEFLR
jgi:hypothetical protein